MKTICCWNDLAAHGIMCLTGESCGLMYRVLCDCTETGRKIIRKCLGLPLVELAEPWNRGTPADPHVGSIMLAPELLIPLGVFALLEAGCTQAWIVHEGVVGVEKADEAEHVQACRQWHKPTRVLRYAGTAGDRNIHVFTGRIT